MSIEELVRPDTAVAAGRVEWIHIAPSADAPMVAVDRIRAIAGVGLAGDRYATKSGTWSENLRVDRAEDGTLTFSFE